MTGSTFASRANGPSGRAIHSTRLTDNRIDGRDLWSGRVTIGLKPFENFKPISSGSISRKTTIASEAPSSFAKPHRSPRRSTASLCHRRSWKRLCCFDLGDYFSQGCLPTSLYSPDAFEVPNGYTLPYIAAARLHRRYQSPISIPMPSTTQSRNLRVIESALNPIYKAKNDVVEFNADYTSRLR